MVAIQHLPKEIMHLKYASQTWISLHRVRFENAKGTFVRIGLFPMEEDTVMGTAPKTGLCPDKGPTVSGEAAKGNFGWSIESLGSIGRPM